MNVFSVVLYTDTRDAFYEAVSFLAAARAQGRTVSLFLRGPALAAFIKGDWRAPADPAVAKGLDRFQSSPPEELLAELRAKGKTHVTACSAWVRMLDLPMEEMAVRVDAVTGLNAFLSQAGEGPLIYI